MEFLRTIAEWRTPFLDQLFLILTKLGEESIVIAVVALLYWCINKKMAYGVGLAYFFSGLTVNTLKITCRIDRPWIIDPAFQVVEGAKGAATSYSFPSGHTQSATALYGALGTMSRKNWLRALFLLAIPVVGFSRMYLGVHTPADVLVGFGVTAAFVLLFSVFYFTDSMNLRFFAVTGAVLTVLGAGALCWALYLHGSGVIAFDYAEDISKMVGASVGFAIACPLEMTFVRFSTRTEKLWQQVVKVVAGIAVALGLKSGLKAVFALIAEEALVFDALRYGIVIIWVILIWPIIFSKLFKAPAEEPDGEISEEIAAE